MARKKRSEPTYTAWTCCGVMVAGEVSAEHYRRVGDAFAGGADVGGVPDTSREGHVFGRAREGRGGVGGGEEERGEEHGTSICREAPINCRGVLASANAPRNVNADGELGTGIKGPRG